MNKGQIAQLQTALDAANGKRRERLADMGDVMGVIVRVAKGADGTGLRKTCGTVAKAYGRPASATQITAVRAGDEVRVRITDGWAATVAGGGNGYVESAKNISVSDLLASADGAIVIPLASAKRAPK